MARPLRVDLEDGVYHVMSRGIDRRAIFTADKDRRHFLEVLAAARDRFRLRIYAYVLMDNHFHLIVCTPDANLSRAV
jgi:REP element-mobilizing transposase RayT